MARLKMIDDDRMNPQMAALAEKVKYDPGYHTGLKIFAHSQEFVAPVWSAYIELFDGGLLDSRLKELVRIKIAQNNDCFMWKRFRYPSVMDKGLTEERIAEIPNYEFSEVLTQREKLALKLAEKMGIEHQALDDNFMTLLRREFSEAEIVELSIVISICVGWGRLLSVFKVEEAEA